MQLLRTTIGAVAALSCDQISKIIVIHGLDLASIHVIPVVPPYLIFLMAWNKGINFGLFSQFDRRWALIAASLAISSVLVAWARKTSGWIRPIGIGFVVGGALGNAVDRAAYGAVVDFINMSCCNIENPYSFNIADIFVFFGAILMLAPAHEQA